MAARGEGWLICWCCAPGAPFRGRHEQPIGRPAMQSAWTAAGLKEQGRPLEA